MPEIQQPDIVGNYLGSLYQAQDRVQKQQDRQRAMQRQDVADQQQAQQFQWTKEQHDAATKADAISEVVMSLKPGDVQGFEAAKQQLLAKGVLTPQEAATLDPAKLQDYQLQSEKWRQVKEFQLKQQLGQSQIEASKANTAQSYATADAARANAEFIRSGKGFESRPLPSGVQNAEDEDVAAIQTAKTIQQKMQGWQDAFTKGGLETGPGSQAMRAFGNATGISTTNSRRLQLLKDDLESLRNDSLRLNKGVQTEGDAVREWNALVANLFNQDYVVAALGRINALNKRAEAYKRQSINIRRARNKREPFDFNQLNTEPGADLNYMSNPGAAQDDYSDVDSLLGLK